MQQAGNRTQRVLFNREKFGNDNLFNTVKVGWVFDSKFIKSGPNSVCESQPEKKPEENKTRNIRQKIIEQIQTHNQKGNKVAILDFTDFEMKDKFDIIRSRSNKDFKRKYMKTETPVINTVYTPKTSVPELRSVQNERRMLSPIFRQAPLVLKSKKNKCMSPRIIRNDIKPREPLKEYSKLQFDLEFQHVDPSVKFTQALMNQKQKNTESCIKFQSNVNTLLEEVEGVQNLGRKPLVSDKNIGSLRRSRDLNDKMVEKYLPTFEINNIKDQIKIQEMLNNKINDTKKEILRLESIPYFDQKLSKRTKSKTVKLLNKLTSQKKPYHKYQFIPKRLKRNTTFKKMMSQERP
ncbi:unnamed protein product [Moneuplotes crassus]|uniref:Uncharacterized protein n=2 Tax=Euplotes crassus TaxID=5936 RepID=A0AAD1XIA8_EUPCR|nr:unnamed protein product [Moneuplotes crassus]